MQIISGKYRARKLTSPDCARPTLQRIKISIFSLIQEALVEDMQVLDLFAGSGALGIECISRGAGKVFFVDCQKEAINCIKSNLSKIDNECYKLLNLNYKDALSSFRKSNLKFDLVFLDPPYESGFYGPSMDLLVRYELLNQGGLVVLEFEKNKDFKFDEDAFEVYKDKSYGITRILVLKKK